MPLLPAYGGFVAVSNPNGFETVYVKGDAYTDGSLRQVPDETHGGDHIEIQSRTNGVWNKTGIDLSGDTVTSFGSSVSMGAAGNHLRTYNEGQGNYATYAHRHYTENAGSAESHDDPVLSAKVTRQVVQPDNSGSITSSSITWTESLSVVGTEAMIMRVYFEVISAATGDMQLVIRRDNASGGIVHIENIAEASFTVGEQYVDIPGWIEDFGGVDLYFEITVGGGGTVGLATDLTDTTPWLAFDYMPEEHQHIASMETIAQNYVVDGINKQQMLAGRSQSKVLALFFKPTYGEEGLH